MRPHGGHVGDEDAADDEERDHLEQREDDRGDRPPLDPATVIASLVREARLLIAQHEAGGGDDAGDAGK